jgi:hypothetical protein
MEIYILRHGKETGPFNEETTQSLLKSGSLMINDLAWTTGLSNWTPLVQVLIRPPHPARRCRKRR